MSRFSVILCAAIVACAGRPARAAEPLRVEFEANGLGSIEFERTQLLKRGEPRLQRVVWDSGEVSIVRGDESPRSVFDREAKRLEQTWSLGRLTCVYSSGENRLNVKVTFTNTGDRRIRALEVSVADLIFPETPTGNGWYQDLHAVSESVDDVAVVIANYGRGTLAALGERFDSEYRLMIEKDFDRARAGYNLTAATISRDASDLRHIDGCRLDHAQSVTWEISLRFGPSNANLSTLASDLFGKYARLHPRVLRWTDRRPIAMLMLASVAPQHHSATNPRGWLNERRLDVTTAEGREVFRHKLLSWARRSVAECRARDAQGAIAWDIEGEQFQPIVYVGDPRTLPQLAPEIDEVADQFFRVFSDAGLKTGLCIRPSRVKRVTSASPWRHTHMGFDPVDEMSAKIEYAKKRWGCSLFYVDTNVTWAYAPEKGGDQAEPESWVMRAPLMRRLAERHPDVLIVPEFQYTGYYSHVSGYKELRQGYASTPERVRLAYPQAFSVINVGDGPIRERRAELVNAVRRGDILMFRGWFEAPENAAVHSIYQEARQR